MSTEISEEFFVSLNVKCRKDSVIGGMDCMWNCTLEVGDHVQLVE